MNSWRSIAGARFADGDLISLNFGDCEVDFRLPVVPNNRGHIDSVSRLRNFAHISTVDWMVSAAGCRFMEFSAQQWKFECAKTFDDIAVCSFSVNVMEANESMLSNNTFLDADTFYAQTLANLSQAYEDHAALYAQDPSWPFADNQFYLEFVKTSPLPWLKGRVGYEEGSGHCPIAYLSMGSRFVLAASSDMCGFHYPDRKNPFTNEELKQFEFDLFDEFLSHIRVTYSPELLAKISPPQLA